MIDEQGTVQTKIMTDYARHHGLLDWTGDGLAEVVVAQSRGVYDGQGRRVATLAMDENDDLTGEERLVLNGDFSGDGVPDVLLTNR
nr:VCBS repeat-containing protein [Pirellulaceae bacterium]